MSQSFSERWPGEIPAFLFVTRFSVASARVSLSPYRVVSVHQRSNHLTNRPSLLLLKLAEELAVSILEKELKVS